MNLKTKLSLIVLSLFSVVAIAQESYTVSGKVLSQLDNLPIPGVNVIVVGTTNGVSTDFDGNYQIQVKQDDVLQFSYIGFKTQTVITTNQTELNVTLEEDASVLDEVVVTGYGTQRKSHLTGAISKVKNEDLDQIAVARVDDALVGQVSGVNIQATEGEAGSAPTIRIRGTGSISGSSDPAIVVDGLVVDSDFLGNLDMNDVESFEVLKDAASASIYGSRGANGVILITTKQGKEGKTKFTYNTFTGWKEARQSDDYYFTVAETAAAELAANGVLSDRTRVKQLIGVDRDWQDVIFDGGIINSHAFSARGGTKATKFSTSLNYLHDEGVLLTDDYKKYSIRLRLDTKVNDKLSLGMNLSPSYSNRQRFDGSTHDILRQTPWLPLYITEETLPFVNKLRDGGKYAYAQVGDYAIQRMFDDYDLDTMQPVESGGTDISNTSNTNPAAKVLERDRNDYKFKLAGSFYGQYNITNDLSFRTTLSGDFQNTKRDRWQGIQASRNGAAATQLDVSTQNRIHMVTDNLFSYNKIINDKHEISAVLGFSAEKWDTTFESATGAGYDSDLVQTISAADPTTVIANSYEFTERLMSYLGRVNYAFDDKYLVSLSFRRDGYSAFGENNKYGNFPAASVGWIASNEDFLSESETISNLKFRFSYGVAGNPFFNTGNVLVDKFPYLSLLQTSTAVVDGNVSTGFNPINLANPDLQWERSVEINPGIDFGILNNAITGSIEYYKRTSDQLLIDNPVSSTTGFNSALVNIGEVQNSGFEFELRTRNMSKENFRWSSTILASRNKNELLDFADSDGQIQNVDSKRAAEWINSVGNPISSFYGWVVDRDIPLEYISNPYHPVGGEAQDVYVKDLNGDGLIDDDDKTILGDPYPDFVWSVTNDFKIGKFDFSFMFQGSHGAEIRNMGDQYLFNQFNSSQDFISSTPDQEFIKQKIFTDDIIQDASYVAMRNINVGFAVPEKLLNKLSLTKARLYLSGQNLLYFTADGYTGFNPESINTTSPTTYGYQRAGSPINQTVTIGLNVEF